ncbi:glycosyltransferase family 4 protein [Phaeobacter sp. HF9A]|nr:glycosyltransferase family 4 protein [Phaeobacter sp. HF9A]NIZ15247.1 glycosyltransferase family 4 protein [Phaeobacter sp. HF9A]
MKAPTHPTPSGDRAMGRNLMALLAEGGAEVTLASELRIYDKQGDAATQAMLRQQAEAESARLIATLPPLDLWVSYHNYYKAPDLIGPAVARARGIPYVQIESTRASKRLTGPWAGFAEAAHRAADQAAVIFYQTQQDYETLARDRAGAQRLVHLPPFLPLEDLPEASALQGPMLAAGMMRPGDKLASYALIAETLHQLDTLHQMAGRAGDWRLLIAGDGPARAEVEALVAPFGDRVKLLGQLDTEAMARAYGTASLFLWPGVNEAYGMVYLEAQAHGLPVVAQDRPGLRDVLLPGRYPSPQVGAQALAEAVARLLDNASERARLGPRARHHIAAHHLRPAACATLWSALPPLLENTR